MPEEINRIMCDHSSTLLFSPTKTGFENLVRESFNAKNKRPFSADNPGIFLCGDVMYDNSLYFGKLSKQGSKVLAENNLVNKNFVLATIHRDSNTDKPERLSAIFKSFLNIIESHKIEIVLPLHPRTKKLLEKNLGEDLYRKVSGQSALKIIEPVSFLDMIALESNCKMVVTDSGGVQKEAYFFQKPCIILRSETEWKEIVEVGAAVVADADEGKILNAFNSFTNNKDKLRFPSIFGDGKASEFICSTLLDEN